MQTPTQVSPALASDADRARYYTAALRALRFVEHRSPTARRFGSEADARWGAFRGSLTTADRIDLLIRDADAHWPASFGARHVLVQTGAAEDEAFGAQWTPLEPIDAEDLWRTTLAEPPPAEPKDALTAVAAAWGFPLLPFAVPPISPTDKLLVVGPSAVAAAIVAFASGRDLDWADQAACVATPHGHRQLAALAAALLNSTKPTTLLSAGEALKGALGRRLVASEDASPEDLAHAQSLLEMASVPGA